MKLKELYKFVTLLETFLSHLICISAEAMKDRKLAKISSSY